MKRREFFKVTTTYTGGLLLLPEFLHAFGRENNDSIKGMKRLIFIQLNGGNDGLNTFIPFENDLYYALRPNVSISKTQVIASANGMGWHPSLKNFSNIQQSGHLTVVQNVGYPNPIRSHFRSQEIWNTGSASNEYRMKGWLGSFLDFHNLEHNPIAGINLDSIDNLALLGKEPNFITLSNPNQIKNNRSLSDEQYILSNNPQLDFVKKIADAAYDGNEEIRKVLGSSSKVKEIFPNTGLGRNLKWIADLIAGGINTSVFYTSMGSFDTHDNQLSLHKNKLEELDQAVGSLYAFLKDAQLLEETTIVVFSEFGRRVKDNGRGTDHGTAAPLFIIGKSSRQPILGTNPNLSDLDKGDLKFELDFRSVYASLLKSHFNFDARKIGISNPILKDLV